jgi:hypothetical protein
MSNTIQKAIDFAVKIANDNSHGYAQDDRGGNPNYDCSSLMCSAWEAAGIKVKEAGASYTGNMKAGFTKCGFTDVIKEVDLKTMKGLQAGDVLLKEGVHTAMYIGNGQLVHASINEKGTITGGKSGDQTGKEICVRSYYNNNWNVVLRYNEPKPVIQPTKPKWVKPVTCGLSDAEFTSICEFLYASKVFTDVQGVVDAQYSSNHKYKDALLKGIATLGGWKGI